MRSSFKITIAIACAVLAGMVLAGEIQQGTLKEFRKGDTLTASDLNNNFETIRNEVSDNAQKMPRIVGDQYTGTVDAPVIGSNDREALLSVTVDAGSDVVDVKFEGHAALRGDGFDGDDLYEVSICETADQNKRVSKSRVTPAASPAGEPRYIPVAVTGFESGVTGIVEYSLCVTGYSDAKEVNVHMRGLVATVVPQ